MLFYGFRFVNYNNSKFLPNPSVVIIIFALLHHFICANISHGRFERSIASRFFDCQSAFFEKFLLYVGYIYNEMHVFVLLHCAKLTLKKQRSIPLHSIGTVYIGLCMCIRLAFMSCIISIAFEPCVVFSCAPSSCFECLSCVNDPSNTQHRKKPSPLTSISPATLLYLLLKVCGVSLKTSAVACTLLCSFSGVPMTVVEWKCMRVKHIGSLARDHRQCVVLFIVRKIHRVFRKVILSLLTIFATFA